MDEAVCIFLFVSDLIALDHLQVVKSGCSQDVCCPCIF